MAHKPSNLYLIGDLSGFTPQIARLVSMMNYTRSTTLQAVAGLRVEELDYLHDPQSNSIGALLAHIGGAEVGYQAATFEAREMSAEERREWGAAIELGEGLLVGERLLVRAFMDHGVVRIGASRVMLERVVHAFDAGASAEEIVESYPTLDIADVYATIAFILRDRSAVNAYMAESTADADRVHRQWEERYPTAGLRQRLRDRAGRL